MNARPDIDLALCELRRARDVAIQNAPIHELAGDTEQAKLCREVAEQCCTALLLLPLSLLS